ncbi:polyribonucleotide nucleotidyltransferase [candidate division WOR-3 bacterium]|uniref:Polyribonucleotide nucleotidyltransferase n=1 Tax=candidate division WOR-3 bacterium TaxID=2052148 RepID=A0A660SIL4_UNCW3|nr:MAG: polyribonucleotide nucleotidyltransferase [candidate division WOR-3 bacterium]
MYAVRLAWAGADLVLEKGKVARQADSSILARYGDTVVLAAATRKSPTENQVNFLPLTVDYREPTYSAGKIPGGFFKREGRPREKEILTSRLIDRPLRPLFPKEYHDETQIVCFLLSLDPRHDSEVLSIIASSAALCLSSMPFSTPVGAVRIGWHKGKVVINPPTAQFDELDLNLVVAGTRSGIMMIEGEGREVKREILLEALKVAQNEIVKIIDLEEEMISACPVEKRISEPPPIPPDLGSRIREKVGSKIKGFLRIKEKKPREEAFQALIQELVDQFKEEFPECEGIIEDVLNDEARREMRQMILTEKQRIDGRSLDEIRPISCEVGVLPRTHGSALFTRGETQALVVTTIGTFDDEQIIDDLEGEASKHFMLHYNFPPFSTGEVKFLRAPSRREIGHGALAERSLLPVMPEKEKFPYTIRVVSDILESNGSSSMASVCGASLSLMDAGVPIKKAVAGISIGLIKEGGEYSLLTDIIGAEDHYGDMDFKIAGTRDGITAVQLDLKIPGIDLDILGEALGKADEARKKILDIMDQTIARPRSELSSLAPRVVLFTIPRDKISEVIGPGGKIVRKIIDDTGVTIDIDDDGRVRIAGSSTESVERAQQLIQSIAAEVEVGRSYIGKVTRITNFGAFVEFLPGKEGLIHISKMGHGRVRRVEDVLQVGDEVVVKVIEIDRLGRINLALREVGGRG